MPIFQSFNPKIKAWVKYHFVKGDFKILDVKERESLKPFKNIPKKGKHISVYTKMKGKLKRRKNK